VQHLRLTTFAGTATLYSNPVRYRIVPQPFSDDFGAFAAPPSRKSSSACHTLNADKAAGRDLQTYDINGIVYAFCRWASAGLVQQWSFCQSVLCA
jgi:hypothetical protein